MGRKPDFNLCVKPKEGPGAYSKVGVAWQDDQGRISISLHPCVVLSSRDDVWISLYPNDQRDGQSRRYYGRQHQTDFRDAPPEPPPMSDDDVPF